MKVFIAGGGTGGHFYPAVSVSKYLTEKLNAEVYYFGTKYGIEAKKDFPAKHKKLLDIKGVRGKNPIQSLKNSLKLLKATLQLVSTIKKEKPDFTLCFGGYTAVPLGLASAITGTPLFIHEQNSIPSYSNLLLSKVAKKVFITFPFTEKYFPPEKTILSGMPVREELKQQIKTPTKEARERLSLPLDKKVVLSFGGSQGAKRLAETTIATAEKMEDIHFLLIGGKHFPKPQKLPPNITYYQYIDQFGYAYAAADIVVSRGGASSVYEILFAERYPIFVPFPHAVSNHQYYNVKWLEDLGVATVILDSQLTPDTLATAIREGLGKDMKTVKETMEKVRIDNAQQLIVERIINEIS
ncbi:MAG: UDP-N-acetylglucosamine--N-acetylmuramyl-(pentapeptide) pyrophosphoryl-undecaprenol N-acetylglucosamine transferase [Aquificae bacterium]|nr:UDP-N-acetylglucosamine--N-acetylmuramyl-(pentapeptide) pyrophosphoryl-undecaprenol N-acetylglucosamine transferase [Aquificota bacterium]